MSEHSPLPWSAEQDNIWDANHKIVVYGSNLPKNPTANRRLIVRAVNSHDALLAAARHTLARRIDEPWWIVEDVLRAAIAAAEELAQ